MNLSTDNAEIVAQIQQQCMQEARREYEATVQDTDLQLQHLQAIIVQRTKDNAEVKQLLSAKLHEVCLYTYVYLWIHMHRSQH